MVVADDDWRLRGQEDVLKGATLWLKTWTQTRENWDHDHCEFCWAEFNAIPGAGPDVLREGWTDEKEYHWICDTCFRDFKDRFQFKIGE
jgi:predicted transposase YbfD/YdcC